MNNSRSFSINSWKLSSWWSLYFNVSNIAFLQMCIGLMVVGCGIYSYVIWVWDGSGGVETKSTIFSSTEGFVVFTFFGLPCFAPKSTNHLNYVLTNILFVAASSMMWTAVANNYSSSSDSDRISLHFPFPFV